MENVTNNIEFTPFLATTDLKSIVIYPSFRNGENLMKIYFRADVTEMEGWKDNGYHDNTMTGKFIIYDINFCILQLNLFKDFYNFAR